MKDARLIAFEILHRIFKGDAYSNIAVDKALEGIEGKDKAFISNLVYGVVERKITLDFIINQFLKSKAKPKVMLVLYMGTYQLYFMDKVPDSAAVNTAVELAGQVGLDYYKKLINAVLRQISENRIYLDNIDDLSIRYSIPSHLINMWKKMYGAGNTLKILEAVNGRPPVFAVPNTLFVDADELTYELMDSGIDCETRKDAVMIQSSFELSSCKAFRNGLFHIEDMSSFECAKALEAETGDVVFDVCAAPGGKTFTIAERMHNTGTVYAFDLYEHRVKLISDGATRLGLTNVTASVNDASEYSASLPIADRILCDVPCSGFGIIRRKPEIRYKELDSIKELPDIQFSIMSTSARYLKDGGRMIYSTCTLNKRENEKVVERFLEAHSAFKMLYNRTIFPDRNGGDGFFYAVLEKAND